MPTLTLRTLLLLVVLTTAVTTLRPRAITPPPVEQPVEQPPEQPVAPNKPHQPSSLVYRPPSAAEQDLRVQLGLALFTETYGIQLRVGDPTQHLNGNVGDNFALDPDQRIRAIKLAEDFVHAYPEGLVARLVHELVFVHSTYDEAGSRGGYTRCAARQVVVALPDDRALFRALHTLHHELGHLLHCEAPIPAAAWTRLNDHPYFGTANDWRQHSTREDRKPRSSAFVSGYASASLREDIAETFEVCMWVPEALRYLNPSSAVISKLHLLEQSMRRLEPGFVCPALR